MRRADKVIISTAITGSVNVPSQSDHLPLAPDEIVRHALDAVDAGSAVIHLHARHPDGRPAFEPAVFEQIVPPILSETDAVINITTGGASSMTIDERLAAAKHLRPELASLNMGSMNFVYSGIADRITEWKHEWEKPYVLNTYSHPFINSFAQIEYALRELGEKRGTRFEFECYDIGHLYTLAYFVDKGLVKPPFLIQGVFGVLGGIGADHANLTHMVAVADKLFGEDYYLSAFAAGREQMPFATHSAWLGGHVRVGLEDNLWIGKGRLATSNAQQVKKIRAAVEDLGREIATPADARRMLELKGVDEAPLQKGSTS
ncbi:3-keto-5-aminohexanoate cleavage protein [Microbacterium faecale]|uniref:3-keto-5-aminohexanoate cleavage protein n=1 Tax=Microbacterium faecale TaxID=1804630 RepID=A0A916Y1W4_9MICO|nr:3-keto-5-aminohexanoate cleavage protein [Microbacterium faecale]GGD27413.1 3-keto-5-aminohexanoate cleavage protein [Microbacterium faecale]